MVKIIIKLNAHTNMSQLFPDKHAEIISSISDSNRFDNFFYRKAKCLCCYLDEKEGKKKLGTHVHKWLIQILQTPPGGNHVYHPLVL